jgi:type IV pilus assembly protein PilC
MKFRYRAFDRSGRARDGAIDAASADEATDLLARQGLFISAIASAQETTGASAGFRLRLRRGPAGGRHKAVADFLRQLAVLVSTGTTVVDALEALERQARDETWAAVVTDVRSRVEDGAPLSDALAANPRYFDSVCRSLVRAGESGGKLDVMLTRLAELTRRQFKIRQSLIGAMIYPSLLLTVAIVVLTVMICFVLPRFTGLFETLDVPLPPTTKILVMLSNFLLGFWWLVLIVLALGITAVVTWLKSPSGVRASHAFLLRAPKVGTLCRGFATARIARLMGLLLESRVPLLEAIELTREASTNVHYVDLLNHVEGALTDGESLSSAISHRGLIAPSVCEAVRNGERSGQIGVVLTCMADYLEEDNEMVLKAVTTLIEPMILIMLGIAVGLVATSMFMPLFDLTGMAGGGAP